MNTFYIYHSLSLILVVAISFSAGFYTCRMLKKYSTSKIAKD